MSEVHPVGLMTFGNANLERVPWELVVKLCRSQLKEKQFNDIAGYAFIDLEVSYDVMKSPPKSYGGMSGGGVWRAHFTRGADGALSRPRTRLIGVVYWEFEAGAAGQSVRAHERRMLYDTFYKYLRQSLKA
jgi:hypothetical protein